jgi:hypothetical protein
MCGSYFDIVIGHLIRIVIRSGGSEGVWLSPLPVPRCAKSQRHRFPRVLELPEGNLLLATSALRDSCPSREPVRWWRQSRRCSSQRCRSFDESSRDAPRMRRMLRPRLPDGEARPKVHATPSLCSARSSVQRAVAEDHTSLCTRLSGCSSDCHLG